MRYVVAAAACVAALVVPAAVAPAADNGQYSGVAAADGVRIQVRVPGFLVLEDFVDAGAPTAQASLDSIGGSNAFASAPYPGQTVITGPGTFAIATGVQVPAAYPWYTASAYPATPEQKVDQGPVFLESRSGADSSTAGARLGGAEQTGRTAANTAVTRAGDGTVTASAETSTDLLTVGPVSISGLVSKATAVRRPGQVPERSSSLWAAKIHIADIPVAIGAKGLVLAGTTIPAQSIPGINDALKSAHVTIEALQPSETTDGVLAAGLRITTTQPIPVAGVPGTVTYTLGQAFAAATAGAIPPVAGNATDVPAPTAAGTGEGAAAGPAVPSAPESAATAVSPANPGAAAFLAAGAGSSTASGTGGGDSSGFTRTGQGSDVTAAGSTSAADSLRQPMRRPGRATGTLTTPRPAAAVSTWSLFPILLIAGALVALGAHGQRLMRVRKSWSS
jgi:hypothetical protein